MQVGYSFHGRRMVLGQGLLPSQEPGPALPDVHSHAARHDISHSSQRRYPRQSAALYGNHFYRGGAQSLLLFLGSCAHLVLLFRFASRRHSTRWVMHPAFTSCPEPCYLTWGKCAQVLCVLGKLSCARICARSHQNGHTPSSVSASEIQP